MKISLKISISRNSVALLGDGQDILIFMQSYLIRGGGNFLG